MKKSKSAGQPSPSAANSAVKAPTKLEVLTALLTQPTGASLAEMMTATGWQAHSVRGALAGGLKKKG